MATTVTVEDGFYIDPDTNRTFFVNKGLVPPWVKSKVSDWKRLKPKKKEQVKQQ